MPATECRTLVLQRYDLLPRGRLAWAPKRACHGSRGEPGSFPGLPGSCPLIDRLPGCPLAAAARERKFNDVRAKNSFRTPLQSVEAFVCTQQIPHLQPHFQCLSLSGHSTVPTELAWLAFPSDNAGVPLRHCGKTIIPTSLLLSISVCAMYHRASIEMAENLIFSMAFCTALICLQSLAWTRYLTVL